MDMLMSMGTNMGMTTITTTITITNDLPRHRRLEEVRYPATCIGAVAHGIIMLVKLQTQVIQSLLHLMHLLGRQRRLFETSLYRRNRRWSGGRPYTRE